MLYWIELATEPCRAVIHVRNAKCNRLLNFMSAHYTHACAVCTLHILHTSYSA